MKAKRYTEEQIITVLKEGEAGDIVDSALYNQLGLPTEINLHNGVETTFGYYGLGGPYDTTGDYYGKLWRIKASNDYTDLMDMKYTWDAAGNLYQRENVLASETETFTCDFLDRLTAVSGDYSKNYYYNEIGNIISKAGASYAYDSDKPHAATSMLSGTLTYTYDANGNMLTRSYSGVTLTHTWDVENRLVSISSSGNTSTFVYDANGNRGKKTVGNETIIYVNKYYEKNVTTGEVTTHYYLGDKEVAFRKGADLRYMHQDHLGSTSLVTDSSGNELGNSTYYPFGWLRSSGGSLDTDKMFTGQRLEEVPWGLDLYYYGGRYYDPYLCRFISPDPFVQTPTTSTGISQALTVNVSPIMNPILARLGQGLLDIFPQEDQGAAPIDPQALNRYSYCLNNPLKYVDPSGYSWEEVLGKFLDWALDQIVLPLLESVMDWAINKIEIALEDAEDWLYDHTIGPVVDVWEDFVRDWNAFWQGVGDFIEGVCEVIYVIGCILVGYIGPAPLPYDDDGTIIIA